MPAGGSGAVASLAALAVLTGLQTTSALTLGAEAAGQGADDAQAGTCHSLRPAQQARRVTIFCFMVVRPTKSETALMMTNLRGGLLSGCDAHAIYSNVTIAQLAGHGKHAPLEKTRRDRAAAGQEARNWGADPVVLGDMDSKYWPYNDTYGDLQMSGPINGRLFSDFVWPALVRDSKAQGFDWYVQVDPDTVFLPKRLSHVLQHLPLPGEKAVMVGTHGDDCGKNRGQLSIYSERGVQLLGGKTAGCDWPQYDRNTNSHHGLAQKCLGASGEVWAEPAVLGEGTGCCGRFCSWRVAAHGYTDPTTFKQCLMAFEVEGAEACSGQALSDKCVP